MCECIFHQFAVKNVNVNVVITIYCQHNWIFLRQKKIIGIRYLTGQNRGLAGLKNIWPVIMTGNLLSVICSPAIYEKLFLGFGDSRRIIQDSTFATVRLVKNP